MAETLRKLIKEGSFHVDFQGIERSYYFTSILDVDPGPNAPIQIKQIPGFPLENQSGYMYDPLAICRKIAEMHQAQIYLSEGPNGSGLSVHVDFTAAR